jgi:hypothetical protein
MAFAHANNTSGIAARQFSSVEHCFEDAARLGRQGVEPDFFLCPKQDASSQAILSRAE